MKNIRLKSLLKEENIKEEGLEDLEVNLPATVERFLNKLVMQLKGYSLSRKKQVLVVAKIIDSLGMDKNDVMRAIQKIKQSGVLSGKPAVNEASKKDVEDYAEDFQKYMEDKYDGKNIAGWKLDVQPMSGGFHFSKKGSDLTVLATPFWEGKEIIQIDTVDDEGDYNRLKTIPLRCSFYMDTDEMAYIGAMKKFLSSFSGMKER